MNSKLDCGSPDYYLDHLPQEIRNKVLNLSGDLNTYQNLILDEIIVAAMELSANK